jgi:hypothetical protein
MRKASDPIESIAAAIAARRQPKRWHDGLSREHAAVVEKIREAWLAGKLGSTRNTAAREISAYLKAEGIADVGTQGILAWLQRA